MKWAGIAALALLLSWIVLSDLGLPAAPWFERHRAVRPALLCVTVHWSSHSSSWSQAVRGELASDEHDMR
jgi:hypothetical protein